MTRPPSHERRRGPRTFLFLQGPSSPLFARIADRLEKSGHKCLRINLCAGDWVFWRRRGALNFRGAINLWPKAIADFLERENVTDMVLLGEERPHHRIAIAAAKPREIAVFAVEMGYFRPDWVVLERGGSGCNSHFPADPELIRSAAAGLPEPDFERRYTHSFAREAISDLMFNLPNVFFGPLFFPHYRRHALFHPLSEYAGWIRRLAAGSRRARAAAAVSKALRTRRPPFFLFPLQLETDYQIRSHSPFESQHEAIEAVIRSFAIDAPPQTELLFKLHPLDNGLIDWRGSIRHRATQWGIANRVHFIDGGDLDELLHDARGIVTINSTVGLQAIRKGRPTKAMGVAVYDIAGLCHQGPLDRFWSEPASPEGALRSAFLRLLGASLHVRGNFYSTAGIEAAASGIAERLHTDRVNEPAAFVPAPPRARPVKTKPRIAGPAASAG